MPDKVRELLAARPNLLEVLQSGLQADYYGTHAALLAFDQLHLGALVVQIVFQSLLLLLDCVHPGSESTRAFSEAEYLADDGGSADRAVSTNCTDDSCQLRSDVAQILFGKMLELVQVLLLECYRYERS